MYASIRYRDQLYQVDFSKPLDVSIPLKEGLSNVNCFYAPPMEATPVVAGNFIGSTEQGGVVNFKNVRVNPHGNGTHTECVGHIAREVFTINQCLKTFVFIAELISLYPQKMPNGDQVILKEALMAALEGKKGPEALLIRTLPNDEWKCSTNYSGANPPYLHHEAVAWLVASGIQHLLIDLPSVDREEDGGLLLAHKAFWQYPQAIRQNCTISELIYVNNSVPDGLYLLNIQIASFELDVSPSKPVLYAMQVME
ncbi:MAG TPA: cyclase family protein [Saprospiraceae bacterium]|nr:cyclase family protein [Saprospiraceae bacterium]HMQ81647.1 cyclase family protein [Saprospiraceae bacterium]